MINYFNSEPMKYFSPNSTMSKEERRLKLEKMIESGNYLFGEKTDGNWSRAIITSERSVLQTRGISTVTKTYGEIQDKVLFWNNICTAFTKGTTVILGEVYIPGGIDKDVGAILRCLAPKAIARQKNNPLKWRIFDVLAYNGIDMMEEPFDERIRLIPEIVKYINSPLVSGVKYYDMDETFFDKMNAIFAKGGEGCVCYRKDSIYIPGKRGPHAWDTLKVKQEIASDIDCFIIGTEPAVRDYTGKELGSWLYWQDCRTEEKLYGQYFGDYQTGHNVRPISKGYYNNWPGAIYVGVYDKEEKIYQLCKVAGLTEEFKTELRDNFDKYYLCPVKIGGMALSEATGLSIRHPYLKSIRLGDIDPKDCTLSKILAEN